MLIGGWGGFFIRACWDSGRGSYVRIFDSRILGSKDSMGNGFGVR